MVYFLLFCQNHWKLAGRVFSICLWEKHHSQFTYRLFPHYKQPGWDAAFSKTTRLIKYSPVQAKPPLSGQNLPDLKQMRKNLYNRQARKITFLITWPRAIKPTLVIWQVNAVVFFLQETWSETVFLLWFSEDYFSCFLFLSLICKTSIQFL